jgi:hypothetical protein
MAGNWSVIDPETTTNYVLNPAARTTGNFAAEGAGVVSRPVTYQWVGPYGYRVQSAGDNEGIQFTLSALSNAIHYVTMRVLGTLPSAWDWSLDNANWTTPTALVVYGNGWTLYGAQFPAAQANASTTLRVHQNGAGGGNFYVDGIQVEALSYWTTYADGAQEGCEWNGTEDASSSTRSALSRAGGRVREIEATYSFYIDRMIDVGANAVTLGIDSYSLLPGGEFDSLKQEVREFVLGGTITGDSLNDMHDNRQSFLSVLSPSLVPDNQPIRLRYDGASVVKQIDAYYSSGLNAQINADVARINALERVSLRFVAASPFFYDPGQSAATLDTNDSATMRYITGRLRATGQWDDMGLTANPTTNGQIEAIEIGIDGIVYVGGDFTGMDGVVGRDYIASYNPRTDTWATVGAGSAVNDIVRAIAIAPNGDVYIGGDFTNVGDANGDYVAYYDISGGAWASVAAGGTGDVYALAFGFDGTLYIGGAFQNWGDANGDRIVSWTGAAYVSLSTGLGGTVRSLAVDLNGDIVVGGSFSTAFNYIARWNGTAFSAIGPGFDSDVLSVAVDQGGTIYASGLFDSVDGGTPNTLLRIAQFSGGGWAEMSGGLSSTAHEIKIAPNGDMWIIGAFANAGGGDVLAEAIVRWTGSSWAQTDMIITTTIQARALAVGRSDPVIDDIYEVYLGYDNSAAAPYGGSTTATNNCTQSALPRIIITRTGGTSAKLISIRNETIGQELLFNYDLTDGETLTIDLSSTNKSIISSMFGSRMDAVLPSSDFGQWHLQPGDNQVTCFVDTAGGPTITAYLLWNNQYDSLD